jgi:hypothetical protein
LTQLRHLDISHNPGITGDLPNNWFNMRALATLDISHTGIGGTLPEDYAAFQELREFRAANCPGITGQLPPAWGLLKLEVLEITNSGITGTLPREWADALALERAASSWSASLEGRGLAAAATTAQKAREVDVSLKLAGVALVALGFQQLRVLDMSVSGPAKGGLRGTLPEIFAALERLQVGSQMLLQHKACCWAGNPSSCSYKNSFSMTIYQLATNHAVIVNTTSGPKTIIFCCMLGTSQLGWCVRGS